MIKVLNGQLVVPDFVTFSDDLSALAQLVAPDTSGANADYIPPLRSVDPLPITSTLRYGHGNRSS